MTAETMLLSHVQGAALEFYEPFTALDVLARMRYAATPANVVLVHTLLEIAKFEQLPNYTWQPRSVNDQLKHPSASISAAYRRNKVKDQEELKILLTNVQALLHPRIWIVCKLRWVDFMQGAGLSRAEVAKQLNLSEQEVETRENEAADCLQRVANPKVEPPPLPPSPLAELRPSSLRAKPIRPRSSGEYAFSSCSIDALQQVLDRAVHTGSSLRVPLDNLDDFDDEYLFGDLRFVTGQPLGARSGGLR